MGLQEMRKLAKLTQTNVGKKLGVEKSAVSKWESGAAYPKAEKIQKLAELYSTTTDSVLAACREARNRKLDSA